MRPLLAALAAVLLLGACVAGPRDAVPAPARPAVAATPAPAPAASPAAPAPDRSVAAVPTPAAPPAERGGDVSRLQGMTALQLQDVLGAPDFRRRDGPMELWQYAQDDCILHVGLRPNGTALLVEHVEARARTRAAQGTVTTRSCYAKIVDQRRVAPEG